MAKVQKIAEITPNLPFSEFNFYDLYRSTFEKIELGKMKKLLPLRELAENFGLINKIMIPKRGRKSFFTPEGKAALMFLKMCTGLSCPKLMEQLNGNIHYQMFCDVIIDPGHPMTNYKLLDDILLELAGGLRIQQQQDILVDGISFIEKLTYNAFNEGTRLIHCVKMHKRQFGVDEKKDWRRYRICRNREQGLAPLFIFFGIHTVNVIQLADRIEQRAQLTAA